MKKETVHLGVALDVDTAADRDFLVKKGINMSTFVRDAIKEKAQRLRMFDQWESKVLAEALAQEEAARMKGGN